MRASLVGVLVLVLATCAFGYNECPTFSTYENACNVADLTADYLPSASGVVAGISGVLSFVGVSGDNLWDGATALNAAEVNELCGDTREISLPEAGQFCVVQPPEMSFSDPDPDACTSSKCEKNTKSTLKKKSTSSSISLPQPGCLIADLTRKTFAMTLEDVSFGIGVGFELNLHNFAIDATGCLPGPDLQFTEVAQGKGRYAGRTLTGGVFTEYFSDNEAFPGVQIPSEYQGSINLHAIHKGSIAATLAIPPKAENPFFSIGLEELKWTIGINLDLNNDGRLLNPSSVLTAVFDGDALTDTDMKALDFAFVGDLEEWTAGVELCLLFGAESVCRTVVKFGSARSQTLVAHDGTSWDFLFFATLRIDSPLEWLLNGELEFVYEELEDICSWLKTSASGASADVLKNVVDLICTPGDIEVEVAISITELGPYGVFSAAINDMRWEVAVSTTDAGIGIVMNLWDGDEAVAYSFYRGCAIPPNFFAQIDAFCREGTTCDWDLLDLGKGSYCQPNAAPPLPRPWALSAVLLGALALVASLLRE